MKNYIFISAIVPLLFSTACVSGKKASIDAMLEGNRLLKARNYAQAKEKYEAALRSDPDADMAYIGKGYIMYLNGDIDAMTELWENHLLTSRLEIYGLAEPLRLLEDIYRTQQNHVMHRWTVLRLYHIADNNSNENLRRQLLIQWKEQLLKLQDEEFVRCSGSNPNLPAHLKKMYYQANKLVAEKKDYEAIKLYESVIRRAPHFPMARYNLAILQASKKNYFEAALQMRCYVDMSSDDKRARQLRDEIYKWDTFAFDINLLEMLPKLERN